MAPVSVKWQGRRPQVHGTRGPLVWTRRGGVVAAFVHLVFFLLLALDTLPCIPSSFCTCAPCQHPPSHNHPAASTR
jgi:hypothetical protein